MVDKNNSNKTEKGL